MQGRDDNFWGVLGRFDALHRGHRALIEEARQRGRVLLVVFRGKEAALGLSTRPALLDSVERERLLHHWAPGSQVVELPFASIKDLSAEAFVPWIASHLHLKGFVVGSDFRFGQGGQGDAVLLTNLAKKIGVETVVVERIHDAGAELSSSRIHEDLEEGQVGDVASILGRPYRLSGTVVHGEGRGRRLGWPTANLDSVMTRVPGDGVYAAWARFDQEKTCIPAAVSIGTQPTIGDHRARLIEAHLISWQGDCYGRRLHLDFILRLRGQEHFSDFPALQAQLSLDAASALRILNAHPLP
jgi:riboflavin kinase/FMN adenylyltransferase